MVSCGKKGGSATNAGSSDSTKWENVKIDSFAFEVDTFHIIEKETKCNEKDGECSICDIYYEKIKNPLMPVHDSINMYIDSLMFHALGDISSSSLGMDFKKRAKEFITQSQDPEYGPYGSWDWTHSTSITRPVQEIISVGSSWGGYTGGAHGSFLMETTNFFTNSGKIVRMADLFTDLNAVNKIALVYFKKDNELSPEMDLIDQGYDFSDEDFKLNENFDITTESIYWQYNSYEIAPYSMGAPSVKVPMKDLEKYLKVKFTEVVIK
jgi:hypothetical protein